MKDKSRQGRLMTAIQPSLPGLDRSRIFTRQFLPGYLQPRLPALESSQKIYLAQNPSDGLGFAQEILFSSRLSMN